MKKYVVTNLRLPKKALLEDRRRALVAGKS
jgi:hypothetical protein